MNDTYKNSVSSPLMQLAMSYYKSGQFNLAKETYQKVLLDDPKNTLPLLMLGIMASEAHRHDEAIVLFDKAIKIKKKDPLLFYTRGFTFQRWQKLDKALLDYKKAISLKSDYIEAYNSMADALKDLGRFDEAELKYKRSIMLKPDNAVVHYCLGIVLSEQRKFGEAIRAYREAIRLKPDYADAHWNLGIVLLTSGMFHEGWQKYEFRWKADTVCLRFPRPPIANQLPQWTGQIPQPGDQLLIFGEQGLGDQLQFSRYIPLAMDRFVSGVSIFVNPSLQGLFRRSFPGVEIAVSANQGPWKWQCPLLSLPMAFGTTLEDIPGQTPYLIPDPERIAYWKSKIEKLDLSTEMRKIGIVWKPGKEMKIANLKAISLQQLSPLLSQPRCKFFSLQKEPDPDKKSYVESGKLIDWSDELKDFDDTAALIMNMDMVISVDTSVAHLAGGLGRTTWLLNRHASDWRWMHDREDSPWYPSMRIFTQEIAGDWDGAVKSMIAALI